jgi:hypothetical protein
MVQFAPQKIVNESGKLTGVLFKKKDFIRLQDYLETLEDSLELAKAIKESEGFILWDEFVAEIKAKHT